MFTCRHLVALQSVDDEISSVYISFFLRWLSCKTPNTRCYDNGDYKRKQMLSTLTFLYYAEHCIHCVVLIRRTGIETKVTSVRVFIFFFFTLRWLRSHCCTFGFPPHVRLFLIAVKRKMLCSSSLYSEIYRIKVQLMTNVWIFYQNGDRDKTVAQAKTKLSHQNSSNTYNFVQGIFLCLIFTFLDGESIYTCYMYCVFSKYTSVFTGNAQFLLGTCTVFKNKTYNASKNSSI